MLPLNIPVVLALFELVVTCHYYGQPSAAVWKDQLFVAVAGDQVAGVFPTPALLYRGAFTPSAPRIRPAIEHKKPYPWVHPSPQATLEIRNDRVLLCSGRDGFHILPLEVVPFLENSAFGAKLRVLRVGPDPDDDLLRPLKPWQAQMEDGSFATKLTNPYAAEFWQLVFPEHRKPDVEVGDMFRTVPGKLSAEEYAAAARYAVQIVGPKSVRLFHAYKDTLFVSIELDHLNNWYFDGNGSVAKNHPKPPDRELRTGKLPADFTEHFAAYRSGGKDYLVTNNGKVYVAAPKGKTEVEVSALWTDPKRPIVGVIQDLANDAVYGWGFAGDSLKPERFYVKFEAKPEAKPYKRTVPLWADRSDAYLESYECARAFRKAMEKP